MTLYQNKKVCALFQKTPLHTLGNNQQAPLRRYGGNYNNTVCALLQKLPEKLVAKQSEHS
jgi:hypothetical protein